MLDDPPAGEAAASAVKDAAAVVETAVAVVEDAAAVVQSAAEVVQDVAAITDAAPFVERRRRPRRARHHEAKVDWKHIALYVPILLVVTAYFLMGSVPLLILKHDTPLDARFVRGFFNTYYRAATFAAGATALSYAFAARFAFAAGAAGLAAMAVVLRRAIMGRMDALGAELQANPATAIGAFRRTHVAAILANLAQLVLIVWSLIAIPLQ